MPSQFISLANRQALRRTSHILPAVQSRTFMPSAGHRVVDQTRQNNDSSQDQKAGHKKQATKAGNPDEDQDHPAKQSDPQQSPTTSTGIEEQGPGSSEAGAGSDQGGVYKNEELSRKQTQSEKEGGREGSMVRGKD
ncbi:hypothetical protein SUNI508_01141 [Seiridium unicorne]|uniref:Uncharacterized protein n=1 Tax=Seiridium unicorne TaxID=138068 RepID=A0ABR2UWU1_9PEZI